MKRVKWRYLTAKLWAREQHRAHEYRVARMYFLKDAEAQDGDSQE